MATDKKKANVIADELQKTLTTRLAALTGSLAVVKSFDTDDFPLVTIGTGDAGDAGGLIKVRHQDWPLALDVLGNTANQYSTHVIQLVFEGNAEASGADDDDINTWDVQLTILGEVLGKGAKVEVYITANTNAPDASDIVAGNLQATYDGSLQWPLMGSV